MAQVNHVFHTIYRCVPNIMTCCTTKICCMIKPCQFNKIELMKNNTNYSNPLLKYIGTIKNEDYIVNNFEYENIIHEQIKNNKINKKYIFLE